MKKILMLLFIILLVLTGCNEKDISKENNQSIEETSNTTNSESNTNKNLKPSEEVNKDNISQEKPKDNISTTDTTIDEEKIIEIREKMFIGQIEDIYYNFEDYNGKLIQVEGMYSVVEPVEENQEKVHFVFRNAPGCCGYDGWAGFLLNYEGEYPEFNDWIKVIGTPEIVKDGIYEDLYLNVISIEVMDERGLEFVNQ